jgi:hypothetical protein
MQSYAACSRDGSVRLWDCASASEIRTLHRQGPAVNAVCVGPAVGAGAGPAEAEGSRDAREWGTDGQHAVAATQDGVLLGLDFRAPNAVRGRGDADRRRCWAGTPPAPPSTALPGWAATSWLGLRTVACIASTCARPGLPFPPSPSQPSVPPSQPSCCHQLRCLFQHCLALPSYASPGVVLQPASSPAQSIALPGMVSYGARPHVADCSGWLLCARAAHRRCQPRARAVRCDRPRLSSCLISFGPSCVPSSILPCQG